MAIKSIIILLKKKILILKGILGELPAEDGDGSAQGCQPSFPEACARSALTQRHLPKGWPVTSPKRGRLSKGLA